MSTLFFEGFNISNNNRDVYLDPKYWTKSLESFPATRSLSGLLSTITDQYAGTPLHYSNTYGYLSISGAKNFTNPPESQTHIQLSGISGINTSSGLYLSFRVLGLNHNDPLTTAFPHAQKIISFSSGDTEYLTIEAIRVTGESSYSPNWNSAYSNNTGIALRIIQNNVNKALYDLRIPGIKDYDIASPVNSLFNPPNTNPYSFGIYATDQSYTRFVHLEFYIKNTGLELRIEGLETKDTYSGNTGLIQIDSGNIDNIKFYNRNINSSMLEYFPPGNPSIINMYWGECAGTISYDDISIVLEDNVSPNYWVGETCRIIPLSYSRNNPFSNITVVSENWNIEPISAFQYLNTRDGDNTYIYTSESGKIYSFRPGRTESTSSFISKDIGGVRMFNEARKVFLNASFVNVYGTGTGSEASNYYEIGDRYNLSSTNYAIYSSFAMKNPVTNNPWTSGDIFSTFSAFQDFRPSGIFGFKKL